MDPGLGPGLGFTRPANLPHAHVGSAAHANSTANAGPLMPVVVKGVPVTSAHPKVFKFFWLFMILLVDLLKALFCVLIF